MRTALLLLTLTWMLLASPYLFGGQAIPHDAANYYYPMLRFLAGALAGGESPAWNPYLLSGHPAVADPQSWYFSLTARALAFANPAPSLTTFAVWQMLHLWVGGLGFLLLARRLGLSWPAATLGALVFVGGGQAMGRLQHSLMTVGYAFLPWTLWALEQCFRGPRQWRPWRAAAFALLAAAMAVNRDQIAYINCVLLLGLAIWRLAQRARRDRRLAVSAAMHLVPALIVGLLLLVLPLLLTLDFAALSNRPAIALMEAEHASLQPAAFLGLLVPDLFGALSGNYWGPGRLPWMALSATGFDWTDDSISHLYLGALPLLLLFAAPWRQRPWRPYLAGLLFLLLYALGGYTPVYGLLHAALPGVDLFRRPADAAFALNALLALFAAAGLDRWLAGQILSRALIPIGLATLAAGLGLALHLDRVADAAVAALWAVPIVAIAAMALWVLRHSPHWAMGAAVLLALDLYTHNAALPYNAQPVDSIDTYRGDAAPLVAALQSWTQEGGPWRAEIYGLGGSWQSAPIAYRIEQTLGYSPLRRADYETLTGAGQNSDTMRRQRPTGYTRYNEELPRRLGIRVVATGTPLDAEALGLINRGQVGAAYLYANPAALPRVVAEGGTARLLHHGTTKVRIIADMARDGRVVLHDLYDPAWTATVDGRDVAVQRVHSLFRAVSVPAGQHEIVFAYRPFRQVLLNAVSD